MTESSRSMRFLSVHWYFPGGYSFILDSWHVCENILNWTLSKALIFVDLVFFLVKTARLFSLSVKVLIYQLDPVNFCLVIKLHGANSSQTLPFWGVCPECSVLCFDWSELNAFWWFMKFWNVLLFISLVTFLCSLLGCLFRLILAFSKNKEFLVGFFWTLKNYFILLSYHTSQLQTPHLHFIFNINSFLDLVLWLLNHSSLWQPVLLFP